MDDQTTRKLDNPSCLKRVVGDSGVVLLARELGSEVPISNDLSVCATFFKPWDLAYSIAPAPDGVSLTMPLSCIVAEGYAPQVLAAIRKAPEWVLQTLLWPHSALIPLAAGDNDAARELLADERTWTCFDQTDWMSAGIYWAAFFEDRDKADSCLAIAAGGPFPVIIAQQARLAQYWVTLVGNRTRALQCLTNDLDSCVRNADLHDDIGLAEVWMRFFGKRDWATRYLDRATQGNLRSRSGGTFALAMAWACVLGEEDKAAELAARAMRRSKESRLDALLYTVAVADKPERLNSLIWNRRWTDYSSAHSRLDLAKALLLFKHIGGRGEYQCYAQGLIDEAARDADSDDDLACAAAELWSGSAGAGAEAILAAQAQKAEEAVTLLGIAESWRKMIHLPADVRFSEARATLERAEVMSANAIDFYLCAAAWKTCVGDNASAQRCLQKGEKCAIDANEVGELAKAWIRYLGRPANAARLLLKCTEPLAEADALDF